MQTLQTQDTPIIEKTKELCEIILSQGSFQQLRSDIDAFMADTTAQDQYRNLVEMQQQLMDKRGMGVDLSDDEIQAFESGREALFANSVAKSFMDAQTSMQDLQDTVSQYVKMTFELGRVPSSEEIDASQNQGGGCCGGGGGGGGCGCK